METPTHIDLTVDDLTACSFCGRTVALTEARCHFCGASTDVANPARAGVPVPGVAKGLKNEAAACLLNILPGLGYFYLGDIGKGFAALTIAIIGGSCTSGILFLLAMLFCMIDCYEQCRRMNDQYRRAHRRV